MINIITDLPVERWEEYKNLRIEATTKVRQAFGTSAEEEKLKSDDNWKERLRNSLANTKYFFVFAEDNGTLIGMVGAHTEDLIKSGHNATLTSVYVKEDYRGQGIATKLIDALLEKIKKNPKITRLDLMVVTTQEPAIALYKKFGFEIVGTVHKEVCVDGVYYDDHIMEKLLM